MLSQNSPRKFLDNVLVIERSRAVLRCVQITDDDLHLLFTKESYKYVTNYILQIIHLYTTFCKYIFQRMSEYRSVVTNQALELNLF